MKNYEKLFFSFLGVLLIVAIFYGLYREIGIRVTETDSGSEEWVVYKNTAYNFEIQHPKNWQVSVAESDFVAINIFKNEETQKPPFIHHNNVTHVSIFPKGVPTDGVLGESRESSVVTKNTIELARDFFLKNDKVWATMLYFKTPPKTWESFGFVWAGLEIKNRIHSCVMGGKEIPIGLCGVGDSDQKITFVIGGDIDEHDRKVEEKILSSFSFLKE